MGSRSECEILRATSQLRLRVINAVPREPLFPVNHLSSPAPNRQNCPLVWPRTNNSDQSSCWRTDLGKSEARKWIPRRPPKKKVPSSGKTMPTTVQAELDQLDIDIAYKMADWIAIIDIKNRKGSWLKHPVKIRTLETWTNKSVEETKNDFDA